MKAKSYEKPAWARALNWWLTEQPLLTYASDSWDFGLHADYKPYRNVIEWVDGLEAKLSERRKMMQMLML